MKKFRLLQILIFLSFTSAFAKDKVIIKANVVRGESFVTANTNPEEIEAIFRQNLKDKGYEICDSLNSAIDMLLIDVFLYQFPTDSPCLVVVVRSNSGVHYFDKRINALFFSQKAANIQLARSMAKDFPDKINRDEYFNPMISDIFNNGTLRLSGIVVDAMSANQRSHNSSVIQWPTSSTPSFLVPDGLTEYLSYCVNFQGIRKLLKDNTIKLNLNINRTGRFEIASIDSPIELTERQTRYLKSTIDAFPIWKVDNEVVGIVMNLRIN
jgi:hypothetical protein